MGSVPYQSIRTVYVQLQSRKSEVLEDNFSVIYLVSGSLSRGPAAWVGPCVLHSCSNVICVILILWGLQGAYS